MVETGKCAPEDAVGASVKITNLTKRFGEFNALDDFAIDIAAGEFVSILGASGSGKTTVLRIIAGLEEPSSGKILIGGMDTTHLPPEARDIGLVFQDYALFPHMTVRQNVAFPLLMRRMGRDRTDAEVDKVLALVGASHLEARRPNQLSGGQQQRIALARALVFGPKLLLLDEPLSALDKNLREQMKSELKSLHRKTGTTIIYVTHDQSEALAMSDRVVVMQEGRVLDIDVPERLYSLPSSPYLATFIGDANVVAGIVTGVEQGKVDVTCDFGRFSLKNAQVRMGEKPLPGQPATIVIRPENIVVNPPEGLADAIMVTCTIDEVLYNGPYTMCRLSTRGADRQLIARCSQRELAGAGADGLIAVALKLGDCVLVDGLVEERSV